MIKTNCNAVIDITIRVSCFSFSTCFLLISKTHFYSTNTRDFCTTSNAPLDCNLFLILKHVLKFLIRFYITILLFVKDCLFVNDCLYKTINFLQVGNLNWCVLLLYLFFEPRHKLLWIPYIFLKVELTVDIDWLNLSGTHTIHRYGSFHRVGWQSVTWDCIIKSTIDFESVMLCNNHLWMNK